MDSVQGKGRRPHKRKMDYSIVVSLHETLIRVLQQDSYKHTMSLHHRVLVIHTESFFEVERFTVK